MHEVVVVAVGVVLYTQVAIKYVFGKHFLPNETEGLYIRYILHGRRRCKMMTVHINIQVVGITRSANAFRCVDAVAGIKQRVPELIGVTA